MGADLCGVIIVGPKHIAEEAKKKAVERVTAVVKAVTKAGEALENDCDPEVTLTPEEKKLVDHVIDQSFMECWDGLGCDFNLLGEWKTPEEFVSAFLSRWEHGHAFQKQGECYRDCMSRDSVDPRSGEQDQDYQIFVAGERTWGNGPEVGSAWDLCQRAEWLGIMDILGLH